MKPLVKRNISEQQFRRSLNHILTDDKDTYYKFSYLLRRAKYNVGFEFEYDIVLY